MTVSRRPRIPSFRRHKASGQGFVEFDGKRHYLGRYELPETRQAYDTAVAEWLSRGRRAPVAARQIVMVELLDRYWTYADAYYRLPDGTASGEQPGIKAALAIVRRLYGRLPAAEFSPTCLKACREAMIQAGWSRVYCNRSVGRIRRCIKWGVENELVPAMMLTALQAVAPLKAGRCEAHETDGIGPVSDDVVDAVLPFLPPVVRAMVEFGRLTGARPAEICKMRVRDVDRTGPVWQYRPAAHKTAHHGKTRTIYIGPKARAVLTPLLTENFNLDAYVFSPAAAMQERHPDRALPAKGAEWRPGDHYDSRSFLHAVWHACRQCWPLPERLRRGSHEKIAAWEKRLGPEQVKEATQWERQHRFSPNQLRHSFATKVRKEHGLLAAQLLLGHAKADVTQIYAEADECRGVEVASKIG